MCGFQLFRPLTNSFFNLLYLCTTIWLLKDFMQHFHELIATKVERLANRCTYIEFVIPEKLRAVFRYKQGQYLTLRKMLDGQDIRRSYSIVNAPNEGSDTIGVLVKQIEGGKMSSWLYDHFKVGESLEVMPPMGHFHTHHHVKNSKTYVGIAAGSGISPVLSNLKQALFDEPNSRGILLYSNKCLGDTVFKQEIDTLEKQLEGRFKVVYLMTREGCSNPLFEGRISPTKLDLILEHLGIEVEKSTYFLCGPTEMIKTTSNYLSQEKKVPSLQVMYEYYSPPDDEDNAEKSDEFKALPNLESMVTLIIDDDEYSFHLNSKKKSILDQAIAEKLPVPFACKGGVCCTCKAQVLDGEVFMEKNFALTSQEVENGYVLTCQCHPVTNVVLLNYDV